MSRDVKMLRRVLVDQVQQHGRKAAHHHQVGLPGSAGWLNTCRRIQHVGLWKDGNHTGAATDAGTAMHG